MTAKLHIFFLTMANHQQNMRNYNHFQRVYFLSRQAELTILGAKGADFSLSAAPGTRILRARLPGKAGLILHALFYFLFCRRSAGGKASETILLTEPSSLNVLGPVFRILRRGKWVVDVWDIPIRNVTGNRYSRFCSGMTRLWVKWSFRFADLFILSIRPDYEFRYFEIPDGKLVRFRNAVFLDSEAVRVPVTPRGETPFKIIYVRSSYTPIMGLDILAEAFAALVREFPDVRLTIVGRIPNALEPQVSSLRKLEQVQFKAELPHEELLRELECCHAMVVPFRAVPDLAQTYPIKVIEGFRHGCVLVVPAIGGMAEMVENGLNGLTYAADDPDALVNALKALILDDSLRMKLAACGNAGVEQYDCAVKNQQILNALIKMVDSESSR